MIEDMRKEKGEKRFRRELNKGTIEPNHKRKRNGSQKRVNIEVKGKGKRRGNMKGNKRGNGRGKRIGNNVGRGNGKRKEEEMGN